MFGNKCECKLLLFPLQLKNNHELLPVIYERVHQCSFLHYLAELCTFLCQVPVVVVRHNDAIQLGSKSEDVTIIVADSSLSPHQSGWCEYHNSLFL